MAVKRGPAKASARPAAWRWQLICAAVSVAAGACCFASGAPALPGVYIDEEFLEALAETMRERHELSPELMEQDPCIKRAIRYLAHRIPGVANAVMEQFRVGVEIPSDPKRQDVAIRLCSSNWGKNYLAARPHLDSLINYSNAFREEEFEILTNLIFQYMDKSFIKKASELRNEQKSRCVLHNRDDFKRAVETRLGRSITTDQWSNPRGRISQPRDRPNGMDYWINYIVYQLPNNMFEIELESHAFHDANVERKIMLRYHGIYRWTPDTGPIPQQRFKLTEIDCPEFANYTKVPGGGKWEAKKNEDSVIVETKNAHYANGDVEDVIDRKTYTWRIGNDLTANKFRETMTGKIEYNAETIGLVPSRFATIDITREMSFDGGQEQAMKVERTFDLDPIPAKLRIFCKEEPLPESGIKEIHFGLIIDAKSPEEPSGFVSNFDKWATLGSTFALEITKTVKKAPLMFDPSDNRDSTISVDLRIAGQTGPNQRFLHLGKRGAGPEWEFDTLKYDDRDMTSSTRETELIGLKISEEPSLRKAQPDLARQLGIDEPNQWFADIANNRAFGGGTSRNTSGCRYDKDLSVLGKVCTGATLYLVANRILSSHAIPRHCRLVKVGEKRDWQCSSTAW